MGEEDEDGEADTGGCKRPDTGVPRMCQVQAVRLYDLVSGDVTLVGWEKGEPKPVGGSNG